MSSEARAAALLKRAPLPGKYNILSLQTAAQESLPEDSTGLVIICFATTSLHGLQHERPNLSMAKTRPIQPAISSPVVTLPSGNFCAGPGEPGFYLHHTQIDRSWWI